MTFDELGVVGVDEATGIVGVAGFEVLETPIRLEDGFHLVPIAAHPKRQRIAGRGSALVVVPTRNLFFRYLEPVGHLALRKAGAGGFEGGSRFGRVDKLQNLAAHFRGKRSHDCPHKRQLGYVRFHNGSKRPS